MNNSALHYVMPIKFSGRAANPKTVAISDLLPPEKFQKDSQEKQQHHSKCFKEYY